MTRSRKWIDLLLVGTLMSLALASCSVPNRMPLEPSYEELEERCRELERELEEYEISRVPKDDLEFYSDEIIDHIEWAMTYFDGAITEDWAMQSLEDAIAYAEAIIDGF